ncbi:hypothetical protein D3C78_1419190 [compost metagenome]
MESPSQMKILSFKNCELHCCHLDEYKKQREAFLKRLFDIEKYFMEKPDTSRFRIWYNIDETSLEKNGTFRKRGCCYVADVTKRRFKYLLLQGRFFSRDTLWKLFRRHGCANKYDEAGRSIYYEIA